MAVTLDYYKSFYAVALSGSVTRAAEKLCLTPPTVTKAIQALEQQLDCQLFIRSARGMHLSAEGKALLERVKPGLALLQAGEQEIHMLTSLEGGTVRAAMSEAAAHYFTMPAVIGEFCTRYPKVRLIIRHLTAKEAEQGILSGDIDLAVMGITQSRNDEQFNYLQIYRSDNIPIVGRKYISLADDEITLEELNKYPLVFTHQGYSIREHYDMLYRRHGLDFRPEIETPTLDIQIRAVSLGLGYSFVPAPRIRKEIAEGELFRLHISGEQDLERHVCLITPRHLPMSRAAMALMEILVSAAKQYEDA
ncbi:MAG: LysR family transcriptional regulator [Lachnospiraceae bacterium]|nr:LysR family transcriptional regulator [Lachnospiraceae bacterium]